MWLPEKNVNGRVDDVDHNIQFLLLFFHRTYNSASFGNLLVKQYKAPCL